MAVERSLAVKVYKVEMWDFILSMLVVFHLGSEYVHYAIEYFTGKREKNVLTDIQRYRQRSKKTQMLEQLQKDVTANTKSLDAIKKKLGI